MLENLALSVFANAVWAAIVGVGVWLVARRPRLNDWLRSRDSTQQLAIAVGISTLVSVTSIVAVAEWLGVAGRDVAGPPGLQRVADSPGRSAPGPNPNPSITIESSPPTSTTVIDNQRLFSEKQRVDLEDAIEYRIRTKQIAENSPLKIFAESKNARKARAFVDIVAASGLNPVRDQTGSAVLRPNTNIDPGITVRGTDPPEKGAVIWNVIRSSMSQANIQFRDGSPVQDDYVWIEIGD